MVESDTISYNAAIIACGSCDARQGAPALVGTVGQATVESNTGTTIGRSALMADMLHGVHVAVA